MKESDLYPDTKTWLEAKGYKVYSEVTSNKLRNRADIVALDSTQVVVVELKTSLSLELIGQAVEWKGFADLVYVGIPMPLKELNWYSLHLLQKEGIGLLYINIKGNPRYPKGFVRQKIQPLLNVGADSNRLRAAITPYHETSDIQGGLKGGGYITEYKVTILGVQEYLKKQGGKWVTLDQILAHCKTHYHNPRQSLQKALREFECEWCENEIMDRKSHYRIRKGVKL